jgi:hypothetical protein
VAADDGEPRDRADRRQGLAAKPERRDRHEIVIGQLRGGMALDRQRQVRPRHPAAVVGDADQPPPAAVGHDLDAPRAGIEGVLDQLLHDACRTLDHLAGSDAVDDSLGQLTDGHEGIGLAMARPILPLP